MSTGGPPQAREAMNAAPQVTRADLQILIDRMSDAEDRNRRNNLRFVHVAEGSERRDMKGFLNHRISTMGIRLPPGGFEIDRAHRIGKLGEPQLTSTGEMKVPDRTIIARFLRFSDRQNILEESRKTTITWNNRQVLIFPDYSAETQAKREKFKDCKKELYERKIKFSLLYPATLRIPEGRGFVYFDDADEALEHIKKC